MNKQKDLIVFCIVAVFIIAAVWLLKSKFTPTAVSPASTKLQVTTSFYPLYFFATQIGGDKVSVTNITPTGVEPHDYEPSAQNIIEIENSKLLILNGGGLEAWASKITQAITQAHTLVVIAGEDIFSQNTAVDPHIWLSPVLAIAMVEKITTGFLQVDPANAPYYEMNKESLIQKLKNLDAEYQGGLAVCAETNIVTSHSAFGHLASAYHLNQISIAGLSPDAEPSPKQLGAIIQLVKKSNIKYIFFESLVSPKLSEMIAREAGTQILVLNPIEGLTPDEVTGGADYFTEMKKNLSNLQLALGCKQ